jgi:hypothetical protein
LRAHGAVPQVVDFGPSTQHMESLSRGVPATLRWFRHLTRTAGNSPAPGAKTGP